MWLSVNMQMVSSVRVWAIFTEVRTDAFGCVCCGCGFGPKYWNKLKWHQFVDFTLNLFYILSPKNQTARLLSHSLSELMLLFGGRIREISLSGKLPTTQHSLRLYTIQLSFLLLFIYTLTEFSTLISTHQRGRVPELLRKAYLELTNFHPSNCIYIFHPDLGWKLRCHTSGLELTTR